MSDEAAIIDAQARIIALQSHLLSHYTILVCLNRKPGALCDACEACRAYMATLRELSLLNRQLKSKIPARPGDMQRGTGHEQDDV